jgi:toxin-antitoxin system PIN domain toxin
VTAVDSNILICAHREDSPWHPVAWKHMRRLAESGAPWAIPWPCVHEFLAVVTHRRIYRPPTPLARALAHVESWRECPSLHLIGEVGEYWAVLKSLLTAGRVEGARVHDARIAAICRQHGVTELWSADRDLTRFAGLKVVNPLVGS